VAGNFVRDGNLAYTVATAKNITVAYNIFLADKAVIGDWSSSDKRASDGLYYYNNIMLSTGPSKTGTALGVGNKSTNIEIRNNIMSGGPFGDEITNSNNIYTSLSWRQAERYGWQLAEGEMVVEDLKLLFVDPAKGDFRLRENSPAIDAGVEVGLEQDYDGNPVPQGGAPDIGPFVSAAGAEPSVAILDLAFDNDLLDDSANLLHGSWQGAPSFSKGQEGSALDLSPEQDNYVLVEHDEALAGMETLNISLWAKKNDARQGGTLLKKHRHYTIRLGARYIVANLSNDQGQSVWLNAYHTALVDDTAWHFYQLRYDGQTAKLLVDDQVVAEEQFSGRINIDVSRDLYIGKNPWGQSFNGLLDELIIR